MDPISWLPLILLVGMLLFVLALGKWYPGSGADQVDWRPTRSVEQEVELELDDIGPMIEASNARRRADGRPEITEEGIREEVAEQEERRLRGRRRP